MSNPSQKLSPGSLRSLIAFSNESQVIQIDSLQIENRFDRVTLSGDLDLTKDKVGLAKACELKALIDSVVQTLQHLELPDQVQIDPVGRVNNPFN